MQQPRIGKSPPSAGKKLGRGFYSQSALDLSRQLPGKIMVRRAGREFRRARLVEVEAYLGPKDLASHSAKGRTARTEIMFGPAGHAYVYFIYGMHWMFNIVCGNTGEAHAVLIRAAEPLDGWDTDLTGPAKLARAFGIAREENGMDLAGSDIFLVADPAYRARIIKRKRIGVDYAKHWKDRLLRFIDANSSVAKRLRH